MVIVIKSLQAVRQCSRLKPSWREMGNILATKERRINTGIRIHILRVIMQARFNIYSVLGINALTSHGDWETLDVS